MRSWNLWVSGLRRSSVTSPAQAPEPSGGFAIAATAGGAAMFFVVVAASAYLDRSASPLTWYLTRAAGITLYLLLWLSVCLGLGITTKLLNRTLGGRAIIYSLHTYVTQLAYAFLTLHLITLLADVHVPFSLKQLAVPFASDTPEPWTGLGVIAMYLLAIIGVSRFLRRFISFTGWRMLHMLAFPLYVLALLHGLGAGSDAGTTWALALYLMTTLAVLWLTGYRVLRRGKRAETAVAPRSSPPMDRFATGNRSR